MITIKAAHEAHTCNKEPAYVGKVSLYPLRAGEFDFPDNKRPNLADLSLGKA